jgi:hypothetical protein
VFKIHGSAAQSQGPFTAEMLATAPYATTPATAPITTGSYAIVPCTSTSENRQTCGSHSAPPTGDQFSLEFQIPEDPSAPNSLALASVDGPPLDFENLICRAPNDGSDVVEECWPNLLPMPPFTTPVAEPTTTWSKKINCPKGSGTAGSLHVDASADGTVFQAVIDDPGYAQHVLTNLFNDDPTQLPRILRLYTQDNRQLGAADGAGNIITGFPSKMVISNLTQTKDPWDGSLSGYSVRITGFSAFVEITWDNGSPRRNIGETTMIKGVDANNPHVSRFVGASGGRCDGG